MLGGEGLLWQDGDTYAVRAGDFVVHRPKRGPHTLRGGPGGLDVLVFGQRLDPSLTALPRAGVAWSFPRWVELADGDTPFAREAAAGPPECPPPQPERPSNVVALDDVPAVMDGRARLGGRAAGAVATGLNHVVLSAEEMGAPAHCHSQEEELFVVLDGSGVLELWPRGEQSAEAQPLKTGDVISRPARNRRGACVPRRCAGHDLSRLRHPRAERHVLLPAIRTGLAARPRHRPALAARSTTCRTSERAAMAGTEVPVAVAVIGGGVVGCAVTHALARRGVRAVLLEAEPGLALAASGTNSGILHTGFDAKPGELETSLILRSAVLREELLDELGVHGVALRCPARPGRRRGWAGRDPPPGRQRSCQRHRHPARTGRLADGARRGRHRSGRLRPRAGRCRAGRRRRRETERAGQRAGERTGWRPDGRASSEAIGCTQARWSTARGCSRTRSRAWPTTIR